MPTRMEHLLNELWAEYRRQTAGMPQTDDYVADEPTYHALKELESALGLDPSDWN